MLVNQGQGPPRVAIIYPFLYHFREPILRALCSQVAPNPEYTIFSGTDSNVVALKLIDPALAHKSISEGGLRWRFLRNVWLGRNFLWQKGLIGISLSRNFDVLIFYGFRSHITTWIAAILSRLTGKRVLIWSIGTYRDCSGFCRFYQQIFLLLAHGVLLFGNRGRDILIQWGLSPDSLYLVFNSLDYDRQRRARHNLLQMDLNKLKLGLFSNPHLPTIMFIGRLVLRKRLDLLLDAVSLLNKRGMPANVLVIGDGPEMSKLRQHAERHHLDDKVIFYGGCHDEEELAPLMSISDLCVCPAALGLTVIHAFAYGIPVITHNRPDLHGPEFEAIVPGLNGQVFRMGDVSDLARTIEEWLMREISREATAVFCLQVVDRFYNTHYQTKVFNAAVAGKPGSIFAYRVESILSHSQNRKNPISR